jgi:hypothetical protein
MVDLGILGDIIGRELSSSNGREQVMKFLTSPEGVALLEEFFERPEARPIAGRLLMPILGSLGVPDTLKQSIQQYIPG